MKITAADIYGFYSPSACPARCFLRTRGIQEAKPGPYQELLRLLGETHEKRHLATLQHVVDLSNVPADQRVQRTKQEIARCASVIYQGELSARRMIGSVACEITGIPDFLILSRQNEYLIRDCKMARNINNHPEIGLQLQMYGWLFETTFGQAPAALEVYNGAREIVSVEYDGGQELFSLLDKIIDAKCAKDEPYSPVGWSKCSGCGFEEYCWRQAEERHDLAMIAGIDQRLATALHEDGVKTVEDLLKQFDEAKLGSFQRPWGQSLRRVGQHARRILRMAESLSTGREISMGSLNLPSCANYVMFDLEGLPPQMDELEKVYLWGLQVFGREGAPYLPALAGFGPQGDREGWGAFLEHARGIFDRYGDIPFVHWHHYERVRLDLYVNRYGDPQCVADRVRKNLLDVLPIVRDALALPLPSYSLKVIEKYIGFKRTQEEYGGNWAIAKYIEACEIANADLRQKIVNEICTYNKEDLEATWAVFNWLRAKSPS